MSNVYRVDSIHGGESYYFNTAKEADSCRPGGEPPESVLRLDSAGECNRLLRYLEDTERAVNTLRAILQDLRDVCPVEVIHKTDVGHRVQKFIKENPLPPGNSADRDGQRSYGV